MKVLEATYISSSNCTAVRVDTTEQLPTRGTVSVDGSMERVLTPSHMLDAGVIFIKGRHDNAIDLSL